MERDSIYYQEATRQLKEQEEARRHFDSMSTNTLGFSAVAFGFAFIKLPQSIDIFWLIPIILVFIGVAISTIYSLWLRYWEMKPKLAELRSNIESLEYTDEALVLWNGNAISEAIDKNKTILKRKAIALRCAYILLSFEVILLGLAIITSCWN